MKYLLIFLMALMPISLKAEEQAPLPVNWQDTKPVIDIPFFKTNLKPGWEERDVKYRRWLACSVRVTAYNGGGGSGTICYYDATNNWAYVISCGHLFPRGYKSAEAYKKNPGVKKIMTWYHNDKKLSEPKSYKAEVLCHTWDGIYDVSLMRFKPDWKPWTCKIAPKDFKLVKGQYYHSCGCDGLREVAHYSVKFEQERNAKGVTEVLTTQNSPRGGRSGGGVFSDDHQLLFICSRGGSGWGYWSSLLQIHKFLNAEGFKFVLDGSLARKVPIKDRQNPDKKYSEDFIPLPF